MTRRYPAVLAAVLGMVPALVAAGPPPAPDLPTDAVPGETVLVAGVSCPGAQPPVRFERAMMVLPGISTSVVRFDGGDASVVANALVLRLPAAGRAREGNVVVTPAADAPLGIELAEVIGGDPSRPVVRSLGHRRALSRALPPGQFVQVWGDIAPGAEVETTTMDGRVLRRHVIQADGPRLVVLDAEGSVAVVSDSTTRAVAPLVRPGRRRPPSHPRPRVPEEDDWCRSDSL